VLKELFAKEQQYLNTFFEAIDYSSLQHLLDLLANCEGLIFFSGVGKSGLVAEKISQTMASTGTRAFFLAPGNALHGDIGIISDKDIFVMLSKSGESDELLNIIPFLRNKGVKTACLVCSHNSRMTKACDYNVVLPPVKELCPFDLAPTTSTVIQMIIGDVLAVSLMRMKNFSLDEFAKNHPAGRIGRRITLKVSDLMLKGSDIPLCGPSDLIVDVLVELSNKRCGCVLVIDEQHELLGIFTDGDLRRALQNLGALALNTRMGQLMVRMPRFIRPNDLASQAMQMMESDQKHPITVLPVLDEDNKVVGIIKMHDLVQSGI
jgi:arabinose-5-phosphate isomerase